MPRFAPRSSLVAAVFTLFALPAIAQHAGTPVVTVNDQPISLGEILALYEQLGPETEGMEDQVVWDLMIDQLARQEALSQQAEADPTARDKAAVALSKRAYLAASALERVARPEPDDEDLKALYAELFGDSDPAREYHAAHILVETEEGAAAVLEALESGRDFAEVAEERSLDSTGPDGGDLGWFSPDMMVQPFADAVEKLEPGEISEAFESQFGWHVVQLIDSRLQEPPSFDEAREALITEARRQRVEAAAEAALKDATITRNPEMKPDLLTRTDLLED